MALRLSRVILLFTIFAVAFLSFIFSILATTSSKWAVRDYYDTVVPKDWKHPNYTISRSPFRICTAQPKFVQTTRPPPDDEPTLTLVSYSVSCKHYKPYGKGRTSCELQSVTGNDSVANVGDSRLCQQVHAAGNYAISGTVLISVGFLVVLLLVPMAVLQTRTGHSEAALRESEPSDNIAVDKTGSRATTSAGQTNSSPSRSFFQSLHFSSAVLFYIGAILILLSQFYGILGFIQSSPNNADFASSAAGNSKDVDTNVVGYHGPWYQGVALSAYLTCAWVFALATPVLTTRLWSFPQLSGRDKYSPLAQPKISRNLKEI